MIVSNLTRELRAMDTLTLSKQADLISAHDYYLSTNVVADFCNYFADFLAGRVFNPPYVTRTLRPKCQYVFTDRKSVV